MKKKVEIGQCYDFHDRIFEVVDGPFTPYKHRVWTARNVITKELYLWDEKGILTLRRPFNTEG